MTFHFSFEKVLQVRESEKQVLEANYQDAYAYFEKIGNRLYALLQQKESLEATRQKHMSKGMSILDVQTLQAKFETLQEKVNNYERMFEQARQVTEQKKNRLLETSIDVKRYEKLKDIQFDTFCQNEKKAEQAQLDNIFTTRYWYM